MFGELGKYCNPFRTVVEYKGNDDAKPTNKSATKPTVTLVIFPGYCSEGQQLSNAILTKNLTSGSSVVFRFMFKGYRFRVGARRGFKRFIKAHEQAVSFLV